MTVGTLYVVATPLGNLGDLTIRATDLLRRVPVVAAEDTRRTLALLRYLGASPRVLSYHGHSSPRRGETVIDILRGGQDIALVTDAGTPAISDPGGQLVADVRAAGIPVVPVAGPSAVVTALSGSGLPADRFLFLGFIPRKGKERRKMLDLAAASEWTVVCFEAANRLVTLLEDLAAAGDSVRQVVVARELTKIHEEFRAGTLLEVAAHYRESPPRGEVTVVLAGSGIAEVPPDRTNEAKELAERLLGEGVTPREVVRELTQTLGIRRNEAYRMVMSLT